MTKQNFISNTRMENKNKIIIDVVRFYNEIKHQYHTIEFTDYENIVRLDLVIA